MAIMQQSIGAVPYYYATGLAGSKWEQMADRAPIVSVMILSGPSVRPEKLADVQYAQALGIKVLGYVFTSYGDRSIAAVKADIDTHYSYYGVDGIFLDEVDNTGNATDLAFYATCYQYIKAKTSGPRLVVLNPGATTKESYAAFADHIVVFESRPSKYRTRSNPDWETLYPSSKFWHIIHSCPADEVSEMLELSRQRNAGLIFITDDVPPNPYNDLPTYLDDFAAAVIAGNAGSTEPLPIGSGGGGGGAGGGSGGGAGDPGSEFESIGGSGALRPPGFFAGNRDSFPSRTVKSYTWKLCPFSSAYVTKFTFSKPIEPFGPSDFELILAGSSTNLDFCKAFAISQGEDLADYVTDHDTTEGGMNYHNPGGVPGWMCFDDACPYFIDTEQRYFES